MKEVEVTYSHRLIDIPRVPDEFHPEAVFALVHDDSRCGYVPYLTPVPGFSGNGDLVGDLMHDRRSPETTKRPKDRVCVVNDPISAWRGQQHALMSATREQPLLGLAIEDSEGIRADLARWTSLTTEERQAITDIQSDIVGQLRGSRDRRKREAHFRLSAALGARDTLGRPNPLVTAARHQSAERLLADRALGQPARQRAIAARTVWAESQMRQLVDSTWALWNFVVEKETLNARDVEEFYDLLPQLRLKPVSQTASYMCFAINLGQGQIDNPMILEAVREGFRFEQLSGYIREVVRPIARLSVTQALAKPKEFGDAFVTELRQLAHWLNNLKVGGQYDSLVRRLAHRAENCRVALGTRDWSNAIREAKLLIYTLVYRGWAGQPTPTEWYYRPPGLPGSLPISAEMARYYQRHLASLEAAKR